MTTLITCTGCNRHIRRSEPTCPFCAEPVSVEAASAPERLLPTTRLGRAAIFAFATSVSATACGSEFIAADSKSGSASSGGDTSMAGGDNQGGDNGAGGSHSGKGGSTSKGGSTGSGGAMPVPLYGGPFPGNGGVTAA